jgi:TrmH family RNA methyltransferase
VANAGTTISSRQNPLVRRFRSTARGDGDVSLMLIDGPHLLRDALDAGIAIDVAVFDPASLSRQEGAALAARLAPSTRVQVTAPVLAAISPARAPGGIVALGRRPDVDWEDLIQPWPALVVIAVDVQDPGNLGAIIRAADAGGATGVIAAGASADPFGWKALRGAMGSAFRLPVVREPDVQAACARVRDGGLTLVATASSGGQSPDELDLSGPVALALGSEGRGLDTSLIDAADARASIPMRAGVDSLNVAVTAALLVYEARRQRAHTTTTTMTGLKP